MSRYAQIETKIRDALTPSHLEVVDESHMHSVPPGAESHFKLVVVAHAFAGEPLVRRHQRINRLLGDELRSGLHALTMRTLTPDEWQRSQGSVSESPPCLGGGKADV